MSDEEDEPEPAVELGEATPVEGAPLARVTSRLHWPIQRSEIDRKEGEATIRTPDGPMTISEILEDVEETYFERRQEFQTHVTDVIGTGPVATAADGGSVPVEAEDSSEDQEADDADTDAEGGETTADETTGEDEAADESSAAGSTDDE